MPEVRQYLRTGLQQALCSVGVEVATADIDVTQPRDPTHGDWSSNVALAMAKSARQPPRKLAEQVADYLNTYPLPHTETIEVAGPGFLNFYLNNAWLHEVLRDVVAAGTDSYARHNTGNGQSVSVEFVSANPTGPLHAGHGRWAAYGDALCRLLERCGYHIVREFYINDRGRQTDLFGQSLAARKRGEEPPADGYWGDYINDWAAEMPDDADPRKWGIHRAHQEQATTLNSMNVAFDLWNSETDLLASGKIDDVLTQLRELGMVREADGATWLRSSDFGDDADRVLIKSNGEPTYFLPDIAYHHSKLSRNDLVIDILGADHHGYVSRMRAAMSALGHDPGAYEVLIGQNVTLRREGKEVRLAKRAGTMVRASELVGEVGADVTRLTYLLQSIDTTQTINIDVIAAQSAENPVYYLQYAHARIHSLTRRASERGVQRQALTDVDLSMLTSSRELTILRVLAALPDTVLVAMRARAPHQITVWARELAAAFHRFWHDCPILRDDVSEDVRQARLWLVEATRVGLAVSLGILGVTAPQRL